MKKNPVQVQKKDLEKRDPFPYALFAICLFCIWMIWQSLHPTLPKPSDPPKLYANPSRTDLRLTLLSSIQKAKSSIFISMFGLSDPAILKTLQDKIRQNIPVTIYYDSKGSPDVRKILDGATLHPIYQSGIMHQKILVIDEETVFLGSANFTLQSLKMHDNLIIGFINRKVAHFLKTHVPHATGDLRCLIGGQDIELFLLPDPRGHVLSHLKKKIRSASRSLRVALFTLTHNVLIDEILRAKKRGVDITVVIDLHSALGASAAAVESLKKANVRVLFSQGVQLMHHKFIYIDEHTLLCGSANWTKSAFAKNSDYILTLHNLNSEQRAFMNNLWHKVETSTSIPNPVERHRKGTDSTGTGI